MTLLYLVPSALAIVGGTVVGTVAATARLPLDAQAVEIALIGGGAIVVAQIVIAISASLNARAAREAASSAAVAATSAAAKASEAGAKIDTIGRAVDGWRTAALREIEFLRDELARNNPTNLRTQQQAEDAKTNADIQAEASRGARLDATKHPPAPVVKP
jgi:hypothetical protein